MVSDFRLEVEIWPFRACAVKNMQYNPYYGNSLVVVDLLLGRCNVPQNVFLVSHKKDSLTGPANVDQRSKQVPCAVERDTLRGRVQTSAWARPPTKKLFLIIRNNSYAHDE